MVLPIGSPYPFVVNPPVIRAVAVLPAAPAWDATPLEINTVGVHYATFYMSYIRGAIGGAVDFYFEISPMSVDPVAPPTWWRQTLYAGGILAAGVDTQSRVQREYVTYGSTGALLENFVWGPIDLGLSAERIRMFARESGVPGTPGTFGVGAIMIRGE
jgi:hypothetical protein